MTYTIAVSAQQAVYNYYPRIVMESTVEQVNFEDVKVKIVDSFEDIKIKIVDSFEGVKKK